METDPVDPDKNPFDPVYPNDNDDGESIPITSTSTRNRTSNHTTDETSSTHDVGEHTPLMTTMEGKRDEAWDRIRRKYPRVDTSKFTASLDEYDRVVVQLKRIGGKKYTLFKNDDELNDKIPTSITKSLGPPAEDIVIGNEEAISKNRERLKELEARRETASENQRETIERHIDELKRQNEEIERQNEGIEERMSLRDRVKAIFKKYGFTAFAVLSAVGVVIGVIVSNLKSGLTTVAKGVGNGLKAIGKKIGEILPGMIGAIASFIFKTAGQVIGFLGKHAWLLIVAAVVYFVEQFKKKRR